MKARNIKKALGIAMTTAMVFTMAMPAFAAQTGAPITQGTGKGSQTGATNPVAYETPETRQEFLDATTKNTGATLTMHNAPGEHTFDAYQLLTGDISDEINGQKVTSNYDRVLSNVKWGSSVNGDALLKALKSAGKITDDVKTARDFAEYLSQYQNDQQELIDIMTIIGNTPGVLTNAIGTLQQKGDSTGTLDNGVKVYSYELKGLKAGYYFVKDRDNSQPTEEGTFGNYTRYIAKLVGDSSVDVKSETTKVEKKVKEDTKIYEVERNADGSVKLDKEGNPVKKLDTNGNPIVIGDTYGAGYNDTADYEIGESVPYEFVAPLIDVNEIKKYIEPYQYIFHDTMDAGLTFNNDVVITIVDGSKDAQGNYAYDIDNAPVKYTLTANDYKVDFPGLNGDTFTVTINDIRNIVKNNSNIATGDRVVVKYSATVNNQAVTGAVGNKNKVILEYSNNPNGGGKGKTKPDEVIVFTYKLDVDKVDGSNNQQRLADALFVFKNKDGKFAKLEKNAAGELVLKEWVEATLPTIAQSQIDEWNQNWDPTGKAAFIAEYEKLGLSVIVTEADKFFTIKGLDDDIYFLQEIKAPIGYNLLEEDIKINIIADTGNNQDGKLELLDLSRKFDKISNFENSDPIDGDVTPGLVAGAIANNRGTVLPSTGGMGTTLFYAIGGVLLVGAGVLLVSRKRMNG